MLHKGFRINWLLLSLLLSITLHAQSETNALDSLLSQLDQAQHFDDSITAYIDLAHHYQHTDSSKLGLYYAQKANTIATRVNIDTLQIQAKDWLSYYYRQLDNSDAFQVISDSITQLALRCKDKKTLIKVYNIKSSWYLKTFRPDSSLYYHQKLLEEYADDPSDSNYSYAHYGIGHVYFMVQLNDQAKQYLHKAIDQAKVHSHPYSLLYASDALAVIHHLNKQLDSAQYFSELHYNLADSLEEDFEKGLSLELQARISIERGNVDLAEQQLSKAFELISNTDPEYLGDAFLTKGDLLYQKGDYQAALKAAMNGNELLGKINKRDQSKAFEDLYKIYHKLGNDEKAYYYRDLYANFQDSLNKKLLEGQFNVLEMDYQLDSKNRKLEILALKSNQQQQRLTSTTQWLLIVLLLILLIAGYATHLSFKNKQSKEQKAILETKVNARTQELKIANRQLSDYVEELKAFNYITSHDLKEPVRNINSFSQLIYRNIKSTLSKENAKFYDYLNLSIKQLNLLIEGIEDYAAVEPKLTPSNPHEQLTIDEIPEQINSRLEAFISAQNAEVLFAGFDSNTKVPAATILVLEHLTRNGLQYCRQQAPRVEIQLSKKEKVWLFNVKDNGIGIDPVYHDRIFEMFKRLNSRDEFQGSGLGLAICKKIINRLGGEINLESSLGQGANFSFTIPLHIAN